MMESVKQWFRDWSDACEYANECVPDLSFLAPREPYTALVGIAAVCFLIWRLNETRIARRRAGAASKSACTPSAAELGRLLGEMRRTREPAPERRAA
jgi:hypothetical protein